MSQTPENTETEEPTPESTEAEQPANDDDAVEAVEIEVGAESSEADDDKTFVLDTSDDDADAPEDEIARLEAEVASQHDKLLRAVAETENVRRRAQRDKEDTARYAASNFSRDLLGVADNLRRALDSVDDESRKETPALENLMIGVEMTERELLAAFERNNIRRMETIGQIFDPNFHEAMFEYDDAEQPAKTVGQEIEAGYMLHNRALRPAKVGITKGGPKAEAPKPESVAGTEENPAESTAYNQPAGEPGEQYDEEL
jgi:molecular chaperone GrpE